MDATMIFTLFWVFGWVLLLILIWHLKGQRRQKRMELVHKERMMAMEKGIPLPELPDFGEPPARSPLTEALASVRINPRWPLGIGALAHDGSRASQGVAGRSRRRVLRRRAVLPLLPHTAGDTLSF